MTTSNQKGFAHIGLMALAVLVISVVAFAGYRVSSNYKAESISASKNKQLKPKPSPSTKTQAEAVAAPESPKATGTASATPAPTSQAPKQVNVTFTKGGGSLEGTTVKVSNTTSVTVNGICIYTFTLGNSKVVKTNTVASTSTCAISVPLSEFPKNGDWLVTISFRSNDGMVLASGGGFNVSINPQPRYINFTKGGGGQSGDVVNVSAVLAEGQTGTCTYKFSLNGTVRVEKTSTLNNSQSCSIAVATAEFPKSSTYSLTVSFNSNDGLVLANQAPYDVVVN